MRVRYTSIVDRPAAFNVALVIPGHVWPVGSVHQLDGAWFALGYDGDFKKASCGLASRRDAARWLLVVCERLAQEPRTDTDRLAMSGGFAMPSRVEQVAA